MSVYACKHTTQRGLNAIRVKTDQIPIGHLANVCVIKWYISALHAEIRFPGWDSGKAARIISLDPSYTHVYVCLSVLGVCDVFVSRVLAVCITVVLMKTTTECAAAHLTNDYPEGDCLCQTELSVRKG